MTNSKRILFAFLCGQLAQVVLHIIAKTMYIDRYILWAAAAGFIITVAVFAGMCVVGREIRENHSGRH